MTHTEFFNEVKKVRREALNKVSKLICKQIKTNFNYNIGDIIEDHYHIIKIQSIVPETSPESYLIYECKKSIEVLFSGIQLNKDLKPAKRQAVNTMYLSNIKRKITP